MSKVRFIFGTATALASLGFMLSFATLAHAQLDELDSVVGGSSAPAQSTGIVMPVDLLVDADSYVPPFYRGRTLPSAQTDLRLEAIADFTRSDGTPVPPSQIIYTWHQDDRVVGNVSGLGQSSVVLPAPTLYGTSDIEVDAQASDDSVSGSASIALPSTDPPVILYEDNPLLGITYYHALSATTALVDTEMTFAAVPYFAEAQSANDPRLKYAWTVNGSSVPTSATDPSELTLSAQNSDGLATVGVDVTHSSNFYMSSSGSWSISLGADNSEGFGRPQSATNDPFSGTSQ